MLATLIKNLFDANEREVKKLRRMVDDVNALEEKFKALDDEALRAKTQEFKDRLAKGETLDDIQPEAFATVRETGRRVMGMRHYDVQLVGGLVLHQGRIAEMKTGEGKTLVATSAMYLNALEGKGAHLITVNDYLAKRDAMWMGPIYHALGMSVGIINHDTAYLFDPSIDTQGGKLDPVRPVHRREAYGADITYGTNNEFGFDYLRDNMVWNLEDKVQRGHHYTIVDEVDSILIDEARTPLIISGRGEKSTDDYRKYSKLVETLKRDEDYTVEEKSKSVPLTEEGTERVEELLGIENLFDYENSDAAHHIANALRAKECYRNDIEYVVKDSEIVIVDEFTGRLMFGRRYSDGLHQAIEAKENVKIRSEDQTLASITFQNYFKMYTKLAGMTGTAATEEREFREIYGVDVVVIPTNKPIARIDYPDLIYKDEKCKFEAVLGDIIENHQAGRPVLVGTRSIEQSEKLSAYLTRKGIKHEVLNAKHHEREAEIIAQAGRPGAVTIATNMAGRGVDIVLGGNPPNPEDSKRVKEAGGLCIIGTERHESRRIDNQLRGRSGRQGDPGSSRFYVGLDDELMRLFGSERIKNAMEWLKVEDDVPIESKMVTKGIENAQMKVEGHHFDIRKSVLRYDDTMNEQRRIIYEERDRILAGEELKPHIYDFVRTLVEAWARANCSSELPPDQWDIDGLWDDAIEVLNLPEEATFEELEGCQTREQMVDLMCRWARDYYDAKEEALGEETTRAFEKWCLLQTLDQKWIDHLQSIDRLKEGIGLRGYGQKDPQLEFIKEAFEMFEALKHRILEDTVRYLFKLEVKSDQEVQAERSVRVTGTNRDDSGRGNTFRRVSKKIGRNDPCWCGSGKKWKKCHYPDEG
ncbi:MAG: preprotein translocase subunit SecA [Vulcanimicrobiota bacterium]